MENEKVRAICYDCDTITKPVTKEQAERGAELHWSRNNHHTAVLKSDGTTLVEFES